MGLLFSKVKTSGLVLTAFLVSSFWVSFSSGSTVNVCTGSSGCLPDFNVTSGTFDYVTNGNGTGGTLTLSGAAAGNIAFAIDGVLDHDGQVFTVADDNAAGDSNGNSGLLGFVVISDTFSLSMNVDAGGDITGGSVSLTGNVFDQIHGGFQNGGNTSDIAKSLNNVELSGSLLTGSFTGSQLGGIALDGALVDIGFVGGSVTGGVLSEYGFAFAGSGDISTAVTLNASTYLDVNWSSSNFNLDVVVPLPATGMLFISAIGLLAGAAQRRARLV